MIIQEELGKRLGFAFATLIHERTRLIELAQAAAEAHWREIESGNSTPDDAVEFGLGFIDAAADDLASRKLLMP